MFNNFEILRSFPKFIQYVTSQMTFLRRVFFLGVQEQLRIGYDKFNYVSFKHNQNLSFTITVLPTTPGNQCQVTFTPSGTPTVTVPYLAVTGNITGNVLFNGSGGSLQINQALFAGSGQLQLLSTVGEAVATPGYFLRSIGQGYFIGGITSVQASAPVIASASYGGAAGTSTYQYKVIAVFQDGSTSEASAQFSAGALCSDTLNGTNRVLVVWNRISAAISYKLYRTVAGGIGNSATTGFIYSAPAIAAPGTFDNGAAGDGTLPPTTNTTGSLAIGTLTPSAFLDIIAATTGRASVRVRPGTDPTSPNDGDLWYNGTDLKFRVGGTTKTFTLT